MPDEQGVHNTVSSGVGGYVVQAGRIHGGVHFHGPAADQLAAASERLAGLLQRQARDEASARGLFAYGVLPGEWERAATPPEPQRPAGPVYLADDIAKAFLALGRKRLVLLGGSTAASAAPAYHGHSVTRVVCVYKAGHWTRVWHPGFRDRRGRWHAGYWTRTWHPGHRICRRVR